MAVVVVHEPGDWFEETVDAFAAQDYPNLRFLFLLTGVGPEVDAIEADVAALVQDRLTSAFVRRLDGDPGFGAAANEVLRLVEGENGFFWFCHDDIAPDPGVARILVEELYRSNAGIVGPKFVDWDDPTVLESVGLGVDRFGEVNQVIEPGEVDQEQHDGVRDVFVLPSASMLVRADLFRALDGFDPAISFHGEDVELCWRAHHNGARVVVAPSARVRHRSGLIEREPDMAHAQLAARHRLRTVATLTGAARLPVRLLELLVLTVAELVVGIFTGRFREAFASLRGLVGLVPRAGSIVARRRAVAKQRQVPEREIVGLQEPGSSRLSNFLRDREPLGAATGVSASSRRWRESTTAPAIAWIIVLVLFVFGSRSFIANGVPPVGEFLRFPDSPRDLLSSYRTGWNPTGVGETSANPTGWATVSIMSVGTLFRMGMAHTAFVLGLFVVGLIGVWKLATVFPSTRARLAALIVYAASPLVPGAYSTGALDVLIAFAAVPWMVHTLRRAVGVETADPRIAARDLADGLVELSWPERLRRTVQFAIVVGLAVAFEPVLAMVAVIVGVLLALATLLSLASWQTAVRYLAATGGGVVFALVLNIPWVTTWSWSDLVGPSAIGAPGRGVIDLAAMKIGDVDFAWLALAWFLPVIAAVLLARAWRLTWAIRAGVLIVGFGALAVFGDQDRLPFAAPEAGLLLAPVAVGLSIAAGAALAAFDLDVRDGSFGWRQPLGIAASAAIVIGVVPGLVALGPGDWSTPSTPLSRIVEAQLPDVPDDGAGDYHVLLLGDARLLPLPSTEYRDGMSFALMSDDELDVRSTWGSGHSADELIINALDQIAAGSTQRAGRLLAPLGVRYVIVPRFDGVISTAADPLDLPFGLIDALDEQLDIVSVVGLTTIELFENSSWIPSTALLTGATAEASRNFGDESLVRADLTQFEPIFAGPDASLEAEATISVGVVHVAVPYDENWTLTVDGESIAARRAFGTTTAFDVEQGGVAVLSYSTSSSRSLAIFVQLLLWCIALFAASRASIPLARRSGPLVSDETLITFDPDLDDEAPILDPGLDMTDEVARLRSAELAAADADADDPVDDDPRGELDDLVDEPASTDIDDGLVYADDAVDESIEGEDNR